MPSRRSSRTFWSSSADQSLYPRRLRGESGLRSSSSVSSLLFTKLLLEKARGRALFTKPSVLETKAALVSEASDNRILLKPGNRGVVASLMRMNMFFSETCVSSARLTPSPRTGPGRPIRAILWDFPEALTCSAYADKVVGLL